MDMGDNNIENQIPARTKGSDYLWEKAGEPEPEIQKLEALLGKYRHDRRAPVFPDVVDERLDDERLVHERLAPERRWKFFPWRMRLLPAFVTTVAVLVIGFVTFLVYRKPLPLPGMGWDVSRLAGAPRIGRDTISGKQGPSHLGVGQVLETDDQSRARLQAEGIGQIEMEPNSRVRLLTMGNDIKRIALDRGTIHAFIWATPGEFVVDTPSAVTVDLGCAYTLQVDDSGGGIVRTSLGWVGFKLNGHESFIPAGAACATRPKVGPGTPYFEDAPAEFRAALARFDFEDSTPEQRAADLVIVLAQSRNRDALTLWHLLARVDQEQRVLVYDRLTRLVPPPLGTTEEGILRLDQPMLDLWWNALGFDDISIWRHWERSFAGAATPSREK